LAIQVVPRLQNAMTGCLNLLNSCCLLGGPGRTGGAEIVPAVARAVRVGWLEEYLQ
jgi:hypothetical protein